jgi:hypothetical protein
MGSTLSLSSSADNFSEDSVANTGRRTTLRWTRGFSTDMGAATVGSPSMWVITLDVCTGLVPLPLAEGTGPAKTG